MVAADEAVGRCTEGECESKEVVRDGSSSSVKDISKHDVHSVLGSDRAGTKHSETELHSKDKVGGEEEIRVVDGISCVGEFVGDV